MYLGQLPYKVIIRKKKEEGTESHPYREQKHARKSSPKKGLKHNIVFRNELRSINKML